jgi:hypothetical protein
MHQLDLITHSAGTPQNYSVGRCAGDERPKMYNTSLNARLLFNITESFYVNKQSLQLILYDDGRRLQKVS